MPWPGINLHPLLEYHRRRLLLTQKKNRAEENGGGKAQTGSEIKVRERGKKTSGSKQCFWWAKGVSQKEEGKSGKDGGSGTVEKRTKNIREAGGGVLGGDTAGRRSRGFLLM